MTRVSIVVALALSALIPAATAQARPVAHMAETCRAPGTFRGVHVYSLTETGIGCAAAHEGVLHYIRHGRSPEGFTCSTTNVGARDVRLACHNHVGSFHAGWRVL